MHGGNDNDFKNYVNELGGVFSKYYGRDVQVTRASQFREIVELFLCTSIREIKSESEPKSEPEQKQPIN